MGEHYGDNNLQTTPSSNRHTVGTRSTPYHYAARLIHYGAAIFVDGQYFTQDINRCFARIPPTPDPIDLYDFELQHGFNVTAV